MGLQFLLLVLLVLAAGCLSEAPTSDNNPVEIAHSDPVPTTSWLWNSTEMTGPFALYLELDHPPGQSCTFEFGGAGNATGVRPVFAVSINSPEWRDEVLYELNYIIEAHAGALDTRSRYTGDEWAVFADGQSDVAAGRTVVFVAGQDLVPSPDAWYSGTSFHTSIRCEEPFRVLRSQAGTELLFYTDDSIDSESGFHAFPAASAAIGGRAMTTFQALNVFSTVRSNGAIGTLEIQHPDGVESCSFSRLKFQRCEFFGQPGDYTVTLDRVGVTPVSYAGIDYFWGAIAGLDEFGGV